jgi:hypothetical protein
MESKAEEYRAVLAAFVAHKTRSSAADRAIPELDWAPIQYLNRSFSQQSPPDVVAEALQKALQMPIAERRERWHAMMKILRRHSITAWRDRFVRVLRG